ncbi:hypothetical protein CHGG_07184 [Chaetomium globosum CBS 148.51]|uniref:Ketoreductase (KR) domain-containing protein n=1 Tax=Chaetomium globosum (strain ATCC 6205 / CBS 148.51 / DSM 1962 / NBRC 6347 / NRRL 1970) TaxID=306901 RepID=Q2GXX0_CHAGB|nr:uncharacterized protein CHGG_07184 [Chaetomium globosum CBS 148.51]EAQ85932.1 hypothetical protein CHGG_07184 [Chaetomium globosum CBS 148.51]
MDPLRWIPVPTTSYAGRTVIVTGANGGLGLEAARHFARLGAARLILACRRTERGEAAKADIEQSLLATSTPPVIEVWPLDLCSFDSVRAFCRRADGRAGQAGCVAGECAMLTLNTRMAERYEMQVTTNVISTFLLVLMLLPVMKRTAARCNVEPAVTVVASEAHLFTRFVEQDLPNIFESFRPGGAMHDRYGTTKLLDILIVQELAARLDAASAGASPVVVNTANPGLCMSELFRDLFSFAQFMLGFALLFFGRTAEQGSRAFTSAIAGGRESHGKYMDGGRVETTSRFVMSEKGKMVQKKVWDELMEILEVIEPGITANVA